MRANAVIPHEYSPAVVPNCFVAVVINAGSFEMKPYRHQPEANPDGTNAHILQGSGEKAGEAE